MNVTLHSENEDADESSYSNLSSRSEYINPSPLPSPKSSSINDEVTPNANAASSDSVDRYGRTEANSTMSFSPSVSRDEQQFQRKMRIKLVKSKIEIDGNIFKKIFATIFLPSKPVRFSVFRSLLLVSHIFSLYIINSYSRHISESEYIPRLFLPST